jgi:hypothetical protein
MAKDHVTMRLTDAQLRLLIEALSEYVEGLAGDTTRDDIDWDEIANVRERLLAGRRRLR